MPLPAPVDRTSSLPASRARRGRNVVVAVLLGALAVLFYALAFVKLGHH